MSDPINLNPQPDNPTPIDLNQGYNVVSEDTAASRAVKAQFGLAGILGDDYKDLYPRLISGEEGQVRTQAASALDVKNAQQKQQRVQELASTGQLTPEQLDKLNLKPNNPDAVFEQSFSNAWMGSVSDTAATMQSGFDQVPEITHIAQHVGAELVGKHQMMVTEGENDRDAKANQGAGATALNYAMGLIPFYQEYKLRGNVPGVGELSGVLLGENLEDQAQSLLAEPFDQFSQNFPKIMKYLRESDPDLADQFLGAMYGQTSQQKYTQDAFSAINVASFIPAGSVGRAVLGESARAAAQDVAESAIKDVGFGSHGGALVPTSNIPAVHPLTGILDKEILPSVPIKAKAMEAVGDMNGAAIERAMNDVDEDLRGTANPTRRMLEGITSNFRMDKTQLGEESGYLSREQLVRLRARFETSSNNLVEMIQNTMRLQRVPFSEASRAVIGAVQEGMKSQYTGFSNRIFNLTDPIWEPISATWHMGMDIGDVDGEMFVGKDPEKRARISANMNDIKDYEIRRKGAGAYIRIYRPLPENSDVTRNFMATIQGPNNKSFWNAALGWFRTPEDTMGKFEMTARKTAQYPQANFIKYADSEAQYIKDFANGRLREDPVTGAPIPASVVKARSWLNTWSARQTWKEWKRVLDQSRNIVDPETGKPGYTFKDPEELRAFYNSTVGRDPSYPEVEAYFAKKRLDLFDWTNRNIRVYTNKASRGVNTWRIFSGDPEGKPTYSGYFDGTPMSYFPDGSSFGFVISRGGLGKERYFKSAAAMGQELKTELQGLINEGKLKVIRLWAPEHRPLKGFGKINNQRIRYVITDNAENHPLTFNQVPRRGGGHFDYDYDWYIKQANVRDSDGEHWYEGDNTVMPVTVRRIGENVADHLEKIRAMLKDNQEEAAKAFHSQSDYLPMDWETISKWFNSGKLNLDHKIQVIQKDALIGNVDSGLANSFESESGKFRNGLKEGSENAQFQVSYTGERDNQGLFTVNDEGTRNNPLYRWTPAALVDPITTLNRGLNKIINSTFMDDYKMYATEKWLRQAENYMVGGIDKIRSMPYYYFSKAESLFRPDIDPIVKENLMSNWAKIMQFIGQPSKFDTMIHRAEQILQDSMYDALGPKGAVVPTWMLHHVKDPVQFIRKMAFHFKLGMFNPAQFLVQNQTWTNIYAISPRSAPAGSFATMLHWWAVHRADEETLSAIDKWATKLNMGGLFHGWKPGEWKEAFNALMSSGFSHVEGEYAMDDTLMSHSFVGNDMSGFLNLGQMFFHGGVKNVRVGAWYTAFKEFRQLHPTGKISEQDMSGILQKADTYHANMSRASSSRLNRGVFSLPFQFLTYQMRLAELFMGKRLGETTGERNLARFRLASFYAGLYGIPAAVGLTGYPFGDEWRKQALENGYVVGENFLPTVMNEGMPAALTGWVTGNYYNIGDRFGAHGFDALNAALNGDKPWWEILGGASYETAIPTFKAGMHLIWGMSNPDYHVTLSDWVQLGKEITSVNQGWKWFMAAKYGQWLSKNEGLMKNVSLPEASFMALMGLQPTGEDDMFHATQGTKDWEEFSKNNFKQYTILMNRGFRAVQDNNTDLAQSNFKNAYMYFQLLPQTAQRHAQQVVAKRNTSIIDSVMFNFYTKNIPNQQAQQYLRWYQDFKAQEGNK